MRNSLYEPTKYFSARAKAIRFTELTEAQHCTNTGEGGHWVSRIQTEMKLFFSVLCLFFCV